MAHTDEAAFTTVARVANQILAKHLREGGFKWSGLQLNYRSKARPHADKNNLGLSAVMTAGSYKGGEFRVLDGSAHLDPSSPGQGVVFDGTKAHESGEAEGDRYSIVAYLHNSTEDLGPEDKRTLKGLGFHWESKVEAGSEPEDTRKAGREDPPDQLDVARSYWEVSIGRPYNKAGVLEAAEKGSELVRQTGGWLEAVKKLKRTRSEYRQDHLQGVLEEDLEGKLDKELLEYLRGVAREGVDMRYQGGQIDHPG